MSGDSQFAEFTFDHRMKGLIVGEQQDLRELFLLEVQDDIVYRQVLRPGEPDYGQPGYRGVEDRPWLPSEPPPRRSSLDDEVRSLVEPPKPRGRRKRGIA